MTFCFHTQKIETQRHSNDFNLHVNLVCDENPKVNQSRAYDSKTTSGIISDSRKNSFVDLPARLENGHGSSQRVESFNRIEGHLKAFVAYVRTQREREIFHIRRLEVFSALDLILFKTHTLFNAAFLAFFIAKVNQLC